MSPYDVRIRPPAYHILFLIGLLGAGGVAQAQVCPILSGFTDSVVSLGDWALPAPYATRPPARSGGANATAPGLIYASDPAGGDAVEVRLEHLHGTGTALDGQYVRVSSDRLDTLGGPTSGIQGQADFRFPPNDPETEDCMEVLADCSPFDAVNVYYHIDRFATAFWRDRMGVEPAFQADVVTHISGDGGFADASRDLVKLGVGWLFMRNAAKEDEIIYHEYTHLVAAQLGFRLDTSSSIEAQALAEGYADYFTATYTNDPRIGEWIVTCPARQSCLGPPDDREIRTLDTDPAVWNWREGNPATDLKYGICTRYHEGDQKCKTSWINFTQPYTWGIIWGSLLWDVREALGPDVADHVILEAMSRADPASETLPVASGRLLKADAFLFGGVHAAAIDSVVSARGVTVVTGRAYEQPQEAFRVEVYPRPSDGPVSILVTHPLPGDLDVRIYDMLGREVAHLVSGFRAAGTLAISWDRDVAPGRYLVRALRDGRLAAASALVRH